MPNRLANAVMIVMTGRVSPIPVSASVEVWDMTDIDAVYHIVQDVNELS